jgi:DNA-directed RNA polymerase specialized sigma24 family protein
MPARTRDISVSETSTVLLRELAQHENADVWSRFVAFWRPRLQRGLSRLGVHGTDSEDAVQAALANIYAALRKGRYQRSRGRLSAWMFAVAARAALDAKRRDARYLAKVKSAGGAGIADNEEVAKLPREEVRALLERARSLAASDPRDAVVFESLIVGSGCPSLTAQDLGISVEHVYLIKHRLIRRLRETITLPGH